jgi:hypothetical protein
MRQWLGRWRHWVTATRARRSALTLAALVGIAAPFVPVPDDFDDFYGTGTALYENKYVSPRHTELTSMERAQIRAQRGEDEDISGCWLPAEGPFRWRRCTDVRKDLKFGYREDYVPWSWWQYVTLYGAVMLATLTVTFFALTAVMAVVRSWWRWWW